MLVALQRRARSSTGLRPRRQEEAQPELVRMQCDQTTSGHSRQEEAQAKLLWAAFQLLQSSNIFLEQQTSILHVNYFHLQFFTLKEKKIIKDERVRSFRVCASASAHWLLPLPLAKEMYRPTKCWVQLSF